MKKIITFLIFIMLASNVGFSQVIKHFAVEAAYPPFEFVDANNKIQGFDIDLANALCSVIKIKCTFTNQAFNSLIPSLHFHLFDAVISSMDITSSRLKYVTFTHPYYKNSAIFIVIKEKHSNISDLNGKRIGVQNGSTHQKYLMDKYLRIISVPYDSYQNAILDLKNGRLEGIFGDTAVINEWLIRDDSLITIGDKITDKDYFGNGFGIAIRKNDRELLNQFNTALDEIKQNGIYQHLYQKWFK